jgi:hypothetical protein
VPLRKFSSSGTWLASLGGTASACSSCLCTSGMCPTSSGSGNGQFSCPVGIAIDGSGNLWVVDNGNNRVQEFSGGGSYLSQFGGSGNGYLGGPLHIAIGSR